MIESIAQSYVGGGRLRFPKALDLSEFKNTGKESRAILLLKIPTMVTYSRALSAKCNDLERTNQRAVSRVAMTAPLRSNAKATRKKKI
jgi:hypothetical protein